MTKLLEKAFGAASRLPANEQNMIALRRLEDLEGEMKWNGSLAESQDELAAMAREALADLRAGRTKPLEELL